MPTKTFGMKARIKINTDPGRKGKIYYGFKNEYVQSFRGYTGFPNIDVRKKVAKFHLYDELEHLSQYKLPGGDLLTNYRTDRYLWAILDEVYQNYYTVLANCNSTETWTGRTLEQTNHRGGDGATKITSTAGALQSAYTNVTKNLSSYSSTDPFYAFLFIEDVTKVEKVEFRLHTDINQSWFVYTVPLSGLKTGWNQLKIPKGSFASSYDVTVGSGYFTIGTSTIGGANVIPSLLPSWSSITRVEILLDGSGTNTVYAILDEFRIADDKNYPQRYFDTGLNVIPVAWFDGNTALYEIKQACEAEGARFYADEMGALHFENRQFYNLNSEYKNSKWEFNFSNLTDFFYNTKENEIINKVTVKLVVKQIKPTQDIWQYAAYPSISPGQTITVWAEFSDPAPTTTTGIIAPVATTDYLANTLADGSGTNKTAQISIAITRFARSAKLLITNNDAGPVYLTFLKIRGTPAKDSSESLVIAEDTASIARFGVRPNGGGLVIQNKYLADETYARTLADQLIDWYKNVLTKVQLKNRSVPHLQIGDMITVKDEDINLTTLVRITGIKNQFSNGGLNQEISGRKVNPFESLEFFTIGTSSIESTHVISF